MTIVELVFAALLGIVLCLIYWYTAATWFRFMDRAARIELVGIFSWTLVSAWAAVFTNIWATPLFLAAGGLAAIVPLLDSMIWVNRRSDLRFLVRHGLWFGSLIPGLVGLGLVLESDANAVTVICFIAAVFWYTGRRIYDHSGRGQWVHLSPEPGWYPDSDDRCWQRYWDGTAWTDHVVFQPDACATRRLPGLDGAARGPVG